MERNNHRFQGMCWVAYLSTEIWDILLSKGGLRGKEAVQTLDNEGAMFNFGGYEMGILCSPVFQES